MSLLHRFMVPGLVLSLPVAAAEKRAFHIEDLYRLKGVQHLALSPDGSKLAFEVSSQDLKASTRNTQLWLLDVASGQAKQLTFSGKSDTAPQWSKDGRTLTFLSSRSGSSQLWALDASGGEARKVTSFEAGVGAPKLMPGGDKVVFEATVFPEALTDGARHKELSDKLESGPVQAHLADELLYRHWTGWRDFQYSHLFTATFEGKVEALTGGKQDYPGFWQSWDLSPDGREVCVTTNTDAVRPAARTRTSSSSPWRATAPPGASPATTRPRTRTPSTRRMAASSPTSSRPSRATSPTASAWPSTTGRRRTAKC